jgi:hypothetical protein
MSTSVLLHSGTRLIYWISAATVDSALLSKDAQARAQHHDQLQHADVPYR